MDTNALSAALAIDVDPGIVATWQAGLSDPSNISSSDARDLCYALRIEDGSNVDKVLSISGAASVPAAPAVTETPSTESTVASQSSADSTTASSSGSSSDAAPASEPAPTA